MIMCQCDSPAVANFHTGEDDSGGSAAGWGLCEKSLYLLLGYAVNLELL